MTRIVLRPPASPLPLVFFGFGAGSLILSGLQLGLMLTTETRSVALVQAGAGALLNKPLLGLVSALASARFATTGFYEIIGYSGFEITSGIVGWVIAVIALYGGLGLEDLQVKRVLPIGRRGAARRAFKGDLGKQVGPVESEAGVRKQM